MRRLVLLLVCALGTVGSQGEARPQSERSGRGEGEDFEVLVRELQERYPDRRQRALAKLGALGTRDAWELVLRGLADAAPQVADEARVRLAASREPFLVRELLGEAGLESDDEWVRVRAAETLGRTAGEVDATLLARAIDVRDTLTAGALASAIERRARAGLVEDRARAWRELESSLGRRMEPAVRCRMLSALALLAPDETLPTIERALTDDEAGVRCAALEALADVVGLVSLDRVREMAVDEAPGVRATAIDLFERFGSRMSILALADRLEQEQRPALRWRAIAALQRITGHKEALDPAGWRALVSSLPDYWRPERGSAAPPGTGVSGLAGMPILSDRIAFLVDFSGSTWREDEDGRSRKAILEVKLRAALGTLPDTTRFNVVPYTLVPHPWKERLVPATRPNVEQAAKFFEGCNQRGSGNFYDAALAALADPEVDTILVLTDGVPTGGHRYQLDLLFEALLEENRYRRVVFDSILVDAPKGLQKKWLEFAERTGGRSLAVELE